ncbi:hypothetical protein [Methylomonas methanica]|uniref:Uncharacterized protein n=1 Tax=Methylomonas methanica TaxID=421 RepID=A0A177M0C7_METMH|nr:hypothetical protein [Methylomonas methanica]OAH99090.1 hypothetical protein A1332_04145 [Methylomonas methanica]
MNKHSKNAESILPASKEKYAYRHCKLTGSLLLVLSFAMLPNLSHADFVTHPLTDAPSPQPSEPATPAVPEAADTSQPNQAEIDFNEQFGEKKLGTCSMTYKLEGFSLAYKQYDGTGEITCRNGQKALVSLSSKSIGFTIGYSVIEGEAYFTDVKYISEIFGNYVSLGNHFGFKNSVDRQVLTRGEISLVMLGKGKGFDIGFTIGDLSIKPR